MRAGSLASPGVLSLHVARLSSPPFPWPLPPRTVQRIVYNTQPWGTPLQQGSGGDDSGSFGALAAPAEMISIAQAAVPSSSGGEGEASGSGGGPGGGPPGSDDEGEGLRSAELPPLRAFTFLRLSTEMMTPEYQDSWRVFMQAMRGNAQQFKTSRAWRRSLGLEL